MRTRTACKGGRDPVWNETFSFDIHHANELEITIKDDKLLHDPTLGTACVSLSRAREHGGDRLSAEVVCPHHHCQHGTISLELAFKPLAHVLAAPAYPPPPPPSAVQGVPVVPVPMAVPVLAVPAPAVHVPPPPPPPATVVVPVPVYRAPPPPVLPHVVVVDVCEPLHHHHHHGHGLLHHHHHGHHHHHHGHHHHHHWC